MNRNKPKNGFDKRKHDINRKGRQPEQPEIRALKEYSKAEIIQTFSRLMGQTREYLNNLDTETCPVIERIIIRSLLSATRSGTVKPIEYFLSFIMGKPETIPVLPDQAINYNLTEAEIDRQLEEMIRLHNIDKGQRTKEYQTMAANC